MTTRVHPSSRGLLHATMLTLRMAVADLTSTQAWNRLLRVAARHPGRSVDEVLLIARQRPDATELATYDQWRARGVHVRRAERGLALLPPSDDSGEASDIVKVFDITQTNAAPSPRPPAPDLVPVVAALAALADEAGLTVRLRQGLVTAVRTDGHRLDLAANLPISATAGHLVHHLAQRTLPAGPARHVQAAGVAQIIAGRFGLQPPDVTVPEPRRWAEILDPAAPDRAIVATAAAIISAADALTARLRHALDRPTAAPVPQRRSAHIPAPRRPDPTAAAAPSAADRTALYAANAAAAAFYATHLPASRAAAAYLRSRGIAAAADPDSSWQLGVAPPGGDALLQHLRALGFSHRVLLDAGLVAASRLHGGGLYDLFRDRLMFPIHAPDGQIAGFTGRDLSGHSKAKFYNTPATSIFRKSELLYGLALQLRENGPPTQFVVVEGPTDAIAAHLTYRALAGEGVTTVAVAPCGTAFTAAQLALLAAGAGPDTSLIMSFDADNAGARALDRAYPLAVTWPHGRVLGTAPAGCKDIAALLAARGADEALLDLLAAERPLPLLGVAQALAKAFPEGFHSDWPEARVRACRTVAPYLLDAVRHGDVDLLLQSAAAQLSLAPHELSQGVAQHYGSDRPDLGAGPPR
ncbi:toprim domain-containing protein [Catellatospora sichuanensis]|uniref:toprim domain-containing protein n=1 Tax=Catellatospora sichuanensis TaxID=1969805 RepID=UPI001182BF18|nr:toprim domain-containing protein [Catellatospora sichuanensis]